MCTHLWLCKYTWWVSVVLNCIVHTSLVPNPHTPPSEKQSGKQSQVLLDLLPKRNKN